MLHSPNRYSILSCFSRLCFEHRIWMFLASFEEPPSEYGMIWSKCRFSLVPHFTQEPLSRFHTSSIHGSWDYSVVITDRNNAYS